ncbi:MlaA family lipoprotein [Methylosarcina fibrata]|uniref:MlaA family lipoprotein n=1 Tax=Methylosarcina fibrata TaxID=105972 RepID=UPI000476ED68|nr:VacJ family lipoprotein [Methylosarcina fibrata]
MSTPFSGLRSARRHSFFPAFVISASMALAGCATSGGEKEAEKTADTAAAKADPYENFNRKVFYFNDKVDNYVAEPISDAYKWVTPQFVQTGIFNFFNNLKNINVVLNDMLQAKFSQSAQDSGRFLMNTTVGLGGLFDVAKHVGWEQNEEDFEQTLAVWGVPQGSYLVLPFIGPTTTRGIPGSVFDTAANPATYVGLPVQLVSMLNSRASAEGALKFIDEAALDPYVFTRESFLQWRSSLASDGKAESSSDLSEFEDELSEGDAAGDESAARRKEVAPKPTAVSDGAGKTPVTESSSTEKATTADEAAVAGVPVQAAPAEQSASAADAPHFSKVSNSSGSMSPSFEEASKSFAEASEKLEKLKVQKETQETKKSRKYSRKN